MREPRDELAQQLRALREAQGLSVRVLADLVGVSKVTIWNWERGSCKPSPRLISSLAQALDIPAGRLKAMTRGNESLRLDAPLGNEEESLPDIISHAKKVIAESAGIDPGSIKIIIEY